MRFPVKSFAMIGLVSLLGCQAQDAALPNPDAQQQMAAEIVELPGALSESYISAFSAAPQITALRFLGAYDDFAQSGPVTRARVEDHARLRTGLERGQFLGHILAMDLDGNAHITPAEVSTALSLPGWANKPASIEVLFEVDDNQDGRITLPEALRFSHILHERSAAGDLQPIESYFMLTDENSDDIVTRDEMKNYLYEKLATKDPNPPQLRGDVSGAMPR